MTLEVPFLSLSLLECAMNAMMILYDSVGLQDLRSISLISKTFANSVHLDQAVIFAWS